MLLSHSSDVIRLKATAASDEPHPDVVSLPGPLPRLPPGDLTGLHSEGELWDLAPAKGPGVRTPIAVRLGHQVGGEAEQVQRLLHGLHHVQDDERIKETVDADQVSPGPGHPDGALAHRDPILIPTRSHTHCGSHRQVELMGHLYGPLHLNDVAEILTEYQLNIILLINLHGAPQLSLDLMFAGLGALPLEQAGLGDAGRHDGSLVPGHLPGDVTGGVVDLVHAELTALRQLVLVAPEREGLSDVGPGPGELDGELLHGLGVLSG